MHFCPNCGRQVINGRKECPYCQTPYNSNEKEEQEPEEMMENSSKVAWVSIVFLLPVLGVFIGLIAGIIYMGNESSDYKSFGKALLILCILMIVLFLICCFIAYISKSTMMDILGEPFYNGSFY